MIAVSNPRTSAGSTPSLLDIAMHCLSDKMFHTNCESKRITSTIM